MERGPLLHEEEPVATRHDPAQHGAEHQKKSNPPIGGSIDTCDGRARFPPPQEYGGHGRFDLPPDPKPPGAAPPPNGFVVVEELPKPEPKPVQEDDCQSSNSTRRAWRDAFANKKEGGELMKAEGCDSPVVVGLGLVLPNPPVF